jgi:hypothetical protein
MLLAGLNQSTRRKTYPTATLSTINPTQTGLSEVTKNLFNKILFTTNAIYFTVAIRSTLSALKQEFLPSMQIPLHLQHVDY